MIQHYRRKGPWMWRCHVDLSQPNKEAWNFLKPYVEMYDSMIVSCHEYAQDVSIPQLLFMPAIDPFTIKNRELDDSEIEERLQHHNIPTDLPLVVQISRFDYWKDPVGVIQAFQKARKQVDATLVLLGNVAADDPEGKDVYESLLNYRDERILIVSNQDTALVNALQRRAAVVLQKSRREGSGLTVAEAMLKRTPVIGGNVGGIRYQIKDGENGFLVSSVDEAAERIVQLLQSEKLQKQMGENARQTVLDKFLLTRYLEQYLDILCCFETNFRLEESKIRMMEVNRNHNKS